MSEADASTSTKSATSDKREDPLATVSPEELADETTWTKELPKVRGRIVCLSLKVASGLREKMRRFYVDQLRLEEVAPYEFRPRGNATSASVRFTEEPDLHMHSGEASVYWKIGVTVHDVDALSEAQFDLPGGRQFLDIGYLRHVEDPAHNPVELLQTTFESSKDVRERFLLCDESKNAPRAIGQITLRCRNIESSLHFYRDYLGMKVLSVQPVERCHFELYFLAYTDDEPPNAQDLKAVENREWLWQRKYTTIELQHVPVPATTLYRPSIFDAIVVRVDDDRWEALAELAGRDFDKPSFTLRDPDEALVRIERLGHEDDKILLHH